MDRLKTLIVTVLVPLVFAACAAPRIQSTAPLAPPTVAAGQQVTPLPTVTVKTVTDAKLGLILTDATRMTLYRYTKEAPNVSNCLNQCSQNWPPFLVTSGGLYLAGGVAGKLSTITRIDGGRQITYEGTPLYYSAKDSKPGDRTGQGVGGVWFVVQPAAAPGAGSAPNY